MKEFIDNIQPNLEYNYVFTYEYEMIYASFWRKHIIVVQGLGPLRIRMHYR